MIVVVVMVVNDGYTYYSYLIPSLSFIDRYIYT